MRKGKLGLAGIILGAALALFPSGLSAQEVQKNEEVKPIVFMNPIAKSKYIGSTGSISTDNPVLQNTVGVTFGKVTLDLWMNYDLKKGYFNEVDPELTVSLPKINLPLIGAVDSSVYGGYFTFPNLPVSDAQELGASVSLSDLPLNPTIYAGQIFGKGSEYGQLVKGTLSKTFPIVKDVNLSVLGRATYNNNYFTQKKGLSHLSSEATLSWKQNKNLEYSASVYGQTPVGNFRETLKDDGVLSVGLKYSF